MLGWGSGVPFLPCKWHILFPLLPLEISQELFLLLFPSNLRPSLFLTQTDFGVSEFCVLWGEGVFVKPVPEESRASRE